MYHTLPALRPSYTKELQYRIIPKSARSVDVAGACSDEQPEHCRGLGEPCSRGGASEVVALVNSRPAASAPALGRRRRRSSSRSSNSSSSSSSSSSSRRSSSSGHSRSSSSSSAAEDCIAVCEAPPVAPPVDLEAARLSRGGDIKVEALWRSLVETWTAVRLKMKVTRETSSRYGGKRCGSNSSSRRSNSSSRRSSSRCQAIAPLRHPTVFRVCSICGQTKETSHSASSHAPPQH
ncbi:uncharacterized protein DDB_G0271670-like [Penaeus monodon]|uniref:uncharacterized protein DDB_G0271670-like n=1 Tax=Penaeus monodon TaxID=6687 RepID=UPI0018A6FE63|nr:uncharacterized protein DDB_G0271670-like [Penaeus monodon]